MWKKEYDATKNREYTYLMLVGRLERYSEFFTLQKEYTEWGWKSNLKTPCRKRFLESVVCH